MPSGRHPSPHLISSCSVRVLNICEVDANCFDINVHTGILLFAVAVLAFYNGEYKRMHLEKKAPHVHGLLPTVDFTVGGEDGELCEEKIK